MKGARRRRMDWGEGFGLLALAGLTCFFLATSWRKWPDPLVDFGRELYIPWRLSGGAILYRDVDDFYGPLSQYLNSGLFMLFGPGIMVLVAANLAVFAGILATLHLLFRRAWGAGAALASSACFVSVFGFSHFVSGNFNYATPYSHEATHGLLVCLLLVAALLRWIEEATPARSAVAGGLLGLSAVLKPEILFAAALVTVAAVAVRWREGRPLRAGALLAGAVAAVLPTAAFAAYFSAYLPWPTAAALACRAWLSVFATSRFTGDVVQTGFLGLDQPGPHLLEHAWATLLAMLLIAGIWGTAWLVGRMRLPWMRWILAAVAAGAFAWLAWFQVNWVNVGHCLFGVALVYVLIQAAPLIRGRAPEGIAGMRVARLLVALLAAGLMARMLLNGRIYQFGFYQAALAAVLVPAVLLGDLRERMDSPWARALVVTGTVLLLVPGVVKLATVSQRLLRLKTQAVGAGADLFYTLPPQIEPTGEIVRLVTERLRATPPGQTVLVLPEGEMINYLARRASPVAPFFFFSAATSGGREEAIVDDLRRRPPDWVVIISRDLREYGVRRYGEAPGEGGLIMRWVDDNYRLSGRVGGDPLDTAQRGAVILRRR